MSGDTKHPADALADQFEARVVWSSGGERDRGKRAAALLRAIPALEAERDNVRSINARISEEMGQLRAELAALKAQAAQPLKKGVIEASYHRECKAAGVAPRLATFDAYLAGVRFAESQAPQAAQPAALIRTWHKGLDQHAEVIDWCDVSELQDGLHKLYAATQAAQPLTDEQARDIAAHYDMPTAAIVDIYKRALAAAHQAAQPQPLTYDQIVDALTGDAGLNLAYRSYEDDMKFARAIERAHGIGKEGGAA